jgi:hypothetical protein
VSLSNQRKLRPLVLESEIMSLPPMAGFLRLGGGLPGGLTVPGVRFAFRYRAMRQVAPSFLPGENTAIVPEAAGSAASAAAKAPQPMPAEAVVREEEVQQLELVPPPSPPRPVPLDAQVSVMTHGSED